MEEPKNENSIPEVHYSCPLGDFYQTPDKSWKFRAKKVMSESDILKALEVLKKLKAYN